MSSIGMSSSHKHGPIRKHEDPRRVIEEAVNAPPATVHDCSVNMHFSLIAVTIVVPLWGKSGYAGANRSVGVGILVRRNLIKPH